ncbi:MAG: 6-phosphogluconolactonase [Sphingobacteriales bacterium]|nr:6-phosphogluconolactonase [Sphingobacteriales bacterium]
MSENTQDTYAAPDTRYFQTQEEFNKAVGKDFIKHANQTTQKKQRFLVCLSHGQSPAGAYKNISDYYHKIKNPKNIYYTFLNSPLKSQEGLKGIFDAEAFLNSLLEKGVITKEQILGYHINEDQAEEESTALINEHVGNFLRENNKPGFDYVFLASNPKGRIGGIERNSRAFDSKEIFALVMLNKDPEITVTPHFLLQSKRIAFLATKSDKRRPLAWLYSTTGKPNESPSFIRYIENVKERMTVFVDDKALTWPVIEVKRETPYGVSNIVIDLANPYKENAKEKLPVVLLIHGFLGLNSFDGLLTSIPSTKYIAAAMHYGSIPSDLPVDDYSAHVAKNIEAVVEYFGSKGHPVYIFDHSMGNIYFLMIDKNIEQYPSVKKYLRGRIGANPFFGEEAKHALLGFMDNVIIPSMSFSSNIVEKSVLVTLRRIIPLDSKTGVRRRGIDLSKRLIGQESNTSNNVWQSVKERIVYLMTNMDSLPHLNRIPIEKALNKVPSKIFAIQSHSALQESRAFDQQIGLNNMQENNIPILILKSERDGVAKFVPRLYEGKGIEVLDITDKKETDLFREHLYHMVHPQQTAKIIDEFVVNTESKRDKN